MQGMMLFHVLLGGAEHRALRFFDDGSLNLLVSASMLTFETRWKKHFELIHRKKRLLFADSGLLGWIKKEGSGAWKYALDPEKVLEIQLQIDPDIVAHVDIPCENEILKRLGTNRPTAIAQTVQNARWIVERKEGGDERLRNRIVVLVVQGYHPQDYEFCLKQYKDLGFFDLNPEQYWFAIGSVCMRKPPDLFDVVRFVRERIPEKYHVHCFGIANPTWVLRMKDFGINSVDSATGAVAAGFFEFIDKGGKRRKLELGKKDKYMFASMVAFNWASLEAQVRNGEPPALMLFDSAGGW